MSPSEQELRALKQSLADTQPVRAAVDCCKTMDQVGVASSGLSLKFMGTGNIIPFADYEWIAQEHTI